MSRIDTLREEGLAAIAAAADLSALDDLRVSYLGRKGSLTAALKELGKLPENERPGAGKAINEAKRDLTEAIAQRRIATAEASARGGAAT